MTIIDAVIDNIICIMNDRIFDSSYFPMHSNFKFRFEMEMRDFYNKIDNRLVQE